MASVRTAEKITEYRMTGRSRITAAAVSMVLLLMIVFSMYFVALEANGHECAGEDCPICIALEHSIENLRSCSNALVIVAVAVTFAIISIKTESYFYNDIQRFTPVAEKVRMNN
ncbi:MAG: hypothetical protein J5517_02060 [Eubacterium sp.]|nr:hypothetical protein [Eubacterium sp.]